MKDCKANMPGMSIDDFHADVPTIISRKTVQVPEYCRGFIVQLGDAKSNIHKSHNSSTICDCSGRLKPPASDYFI